MKKRLADLKALVRENLVWILVTFFAVLGVLGVLVLLSEKSASAPFVYGIF
jgi:hypothetical protein